jgi:uncharacterized YigZ family protein
MTNQIEKFKTIAAATTSFFKDRGSKFLGYSFPIQDIDDVKAKLNEVKKEHPKATHHCFAYRIGVDGLSFRASDDGEPSGSAGRPILGQIDSAGFTNILVVIVRYYGGTMLGVPGLINAYKTATAEALHLTIPIEKWICQRMEISFDYNAMSEVLYLLKQNEAEIIKQELQLFCSIIADIPKVNADTCAAQILKIRGTTIQPLANK